jgi:hypothetical protein
MAAQVVASRLVRSYTELVCLLDDLTYRKHPYMHPRPVKGIALLIFNLLNCEQHFKSGISDLESCKLISFSLLHAAYTTLSAPSLPASVVCHP